MRSSGGCDLGSSPRRGFIFHFFSNSTIWSKWSIPGALLEFPTSRNTYNAFFRLDMLTTGILPPFLLKFHRFCDCNTRTTVLSQRGVRIYTAEKSWNLKNSTFFRSLETSSFCSRGQLPSPSGQYCGTPEGSMSCLTHALVMSWYKDTSSDGAWKAGVDTSITAVSNQTITKWLSNH